MLHLQYPCMLLNDKLRNELVPINKKYPIQELLDSVKRYVDSCDDKRTTTIEYILIDGINDEMAYAKRVGRIIGVHCSKQI